MGWRIGILAATTAALALSACSKAGDDKSAGGESKPVAAAATPSAAPGAMPNRKPGLWKQTVSTAGMTQESSICLDMAVQAKLAVWGAQAGHEACKQTSITPAPGGWAFASSCEMGPAGKVTTKGTVTGDFNTSYTVEAESVTEGAGAPQMNGAHKMTMQAVWQGPCPANMKPGDMALANGMKFNMLDMSAGRPPMPMHRPGK